jgi:hypothetical protein
LFLFYPDVINTLNTNSDQKTHHYPLLKLFNNSLLTEQLLGKVGLDAITYIKSDPVINLSYKPTSDSTFLNRTLISKSPGLKILPAEQTISQYSNIKPTATNLNLSMKSNPLASSLHLLSQYNNSKTIYTNYNLTRADYSDLSLLSKLSSQRYYMSSSYSSLLTNNPYINSLDHAKMAVEYLGSQIDKNTITKVKFQKPTSAVDYLSGARDRAPGAIDQDY